MSVERVLKELTVYAIVYNLVRVVMLKAAARQGVDVERISFIDALRWLCEMKTNGCQNWSSIRPVQVGLSLASESGVPRNIRY